MRILTGCDIIEIDRVKGSIDRLGDKFLYKIFTENEIAYCDGHGKNRYQHYAARFAAKEAVYKALSGIYDEDKLTWQNFEIIDDESGRPKIVSRVSLKHVVSIDISISHCRDYAVANVVALVD